jgi:hypothetical protein
MLSLGNGWISFAQHRKQHMTMWSTGWRRTCCNSTSRILCSMMVYMIMTPTMVTNVMGRECGDDLPTCLGLERCIDHQCKCPFNGVDSNGYFSSVHQGGTHHHQPSTIFFAHYVGDRCSITSQCHGRWLVHVSCIFSQFINLFRVTHVTCICMSTAKLNE